MKKVYIAGKISGLPYDEVVKKFATAQTELEAQGFKVVNPVEQLITYNLAIRSAGGEPLTEEKDRKEILNMDLYLLGRCTHIYLLNDWFLSNGATMEYHVAFTLGMEILYQEPRTHHVEISVRKIQKNERFATAFE